MGYSGDGEQTKISSEKKIQVTAVHIIRPLEGSFKGVFVHTLVACHRNEGSTDIDIILC